MEVQANLPGGGPGFVNKGRVIFLRQIDHNVSFAYRGGQ